MFRPAVIAALCLCLCPLHPLWAQSTNSGTIQGTVLDPSGAAIAGATVVLSNPLRQFTRTVTTNAAGAFDIPNVPFDSYSLVAQAPRFAPVLRSISMQSTVPTRLELKLSLATSSTTVSVEAAGATAPTVTSTAQTNVDRNTITELPASTPGNGLADLITLTSPSVAADSNGMFHPLGDHAEQTIVVDGQPISDQQSKLFSTSIPDNAIESLDLITAAPSAEYGDKTAMIVEATTRSGLGITGVHGSFDPYYGSFGTVGEDATLTLGGSRMANFSALDAARSGRFLDSPEFVPLHDIGNTSNFFDRFDLQPNANNSVHLDMDVARNWFQIPNTYDQAASGQDQRQQVVSINFSPSYQHIFSANALITVNPWFRRDHVNYYPSGDPFADQPATLSQDRYLTNWGAKADLDLIIHGNNLTVGTQDMQTRLNEEFQLGLTDPLFNAVCVNSSGNPVAAPGVANPQNCASASAGDTANPNFMPGLLPYDLTRNGTLFNFQGSHNINEEAIYAQDAVDWAGVHWSLGLRANHYAGLVDYSGVQPRLGGAYHLPWTGTVLRASYSRSDESPYNENLLLSSTTGAGGLASNVFGAIAATPLQPGKRNDFDTGLQQNLGRYLQLDGDYFWKFTRNAFDFDTLFNTPITFPITWNKSKIDGFGLRVSTVAIHGFTLDSTFGHTRARFFGPENGGIIFNSPLDTGAFRIDHDQKFQQTTNLSYRHGNLWTMLTWRYDSGLVAGAVPDLASLLALNGDQQQTIGFYCGSQVATLNNPITSCSAPYPQWGATRVTIPAPGTENNDTNPPRIASRNVLDLGFGDDALRRTEFGVLSAHLSVTNITNTDALYNFLSTFSGTHFVQPRAVQLRLGVSF
ncbi:MAG TPA: TonB-dependent receptor [Terriglobales bacterium]|nr:TonB-dependent receptor [Terriglobales bacterium]